jgi:hypothetical protein
LAWPIAIGSAMSPTFEYETFISYASDDAAQVNSWVRRLGEDGVRVWIDRDRMLNGRGVLLQLSGGLESSAYMIAFITDAYLSKRYTQAELNFSIYRDVEDGTARTILVKLSPITLSLPVFARHLRIGELHDPATSEQEYARLKRSVEEPVRRPAARVDDEATVRACSAPFEEHHEPAVVVFLIRQAAVALDAFLYRREVGPRTAEMSGRELHEVLIASGRLPQEIAALLTFIRTFGDVAVHDRTPPADIMTPSSIEKARAALRALAAHAFPDRFVGDQTQRLAVALPSTGRDGERQIPGTTLRLTEQPAGRTSLGPLFPGDDAVKGEARSINLVDLPADATRDFLDLAHGYAGLDAPELLVPVDLGIARAADGHSCPYLAFPELPDISARGLARLHSGGLPLGAVCEIGLGVAGALARMPRSLPTGALSADDVRITRYGAVRLLGLGRPGDPPGVDVSRLVSLLRTLITGSDAPTDQANPANPADPAEAGGLTDAERTVRRLAACRSVAELTRALRSAREALPAGERGLRSLLPSGTARPRTARPGLEEIGSYRVRSLRAWPLGEGRVLVWEAGSESLAVLDGSRVLWRDEPVPVRLTTVGRDGRLAVGGWDGAVRYFEGGELVARAQLDGTVGDLALGGDGLVAGSWGHGLARITAGREPYPLLDVAHGVHRIGMARGGDRFAVADLAGRLAIYQSDIRVSDWREVGTVADLAYAGSRLVLLTDGGLKGLRLDDSIDGPRERAGATRLLPGDDDTCVLLVAATSDGPGAPLEARSIDERDREIRRATFPEGARVLSGCAVRGRFTIALPGGGCAYWSDDGERQVWPDARAAELAADGAEVVVALTDRVELYATDE